MNAYRKTIAAVLGAGGTWCLAALSDGSITTMEWVALGIALATALGVYTVPNDPSTTADPDVMPAASSGPVVYTAPRPRTVELERKPASSVIVIPEFHSPHGGRLGRHVNHDPESWNYRVTRRGGRLVSVRHHRRVPIYDQSSIVDLGSCVPHAGKGVLSTAPFRRRFTSEHGIIETYIELTATDDIPGYYKPGDPNSQDTGSDGLSFAKLAVHKGWCASYQHAMGITDALDALQRSAEMTGVNWYEGMDTPDENGLVTIAGAVRGGHEFEVDEYLQRGTLPNIDEDLVGADNSWGTGWGLHGRFYMTVATWAQLLEQNGDVTVLVP